MVRESEEIAHDLDSRLLLIPAQRPLLIQNHADQNQGARPNLNPTKPVENSTLTFRYVNNCALDLIGDGPADFGVWDTRIVDISGVEKGLEPQRPDSCHSRACEHSSSNFLKHGISSFTCSVSFTMRPILVMEWSVRNADEQIAGIS
jgi:hypothetical protein